MNWVVSVLVVMNAATIAACVLLFYRVRKLEKALHQLVQSLFTALHHRHPPKEK